MLFMLVMEHLHRLFKKAQDMGFCSNLSRSCDTFRISLYADDVVLFLKQSQNYHWNCECFCTSFWPNNENEKN
jgi:hypothetical protein